MAEPQDHPGLRPIPRATAERVWRRAIELQDEGGEIVSPGVLLHVARELEVDPVYVEIAMEEVRRADEEAVRGRAVAEASAPRTVEGRSGSPPRIRHIERRSSHLPPGDWWTESPRAAPRGRGVRLAVGSAVLLTAGLLVADVGLTVVLVGIVAGALVLGIQAVARVLSSRRR